MLLLTEAAAELESPPSPSAYSVSGVFMGAAVGRGSNAEPGKQLWSKATIE